MYGLLFKVLFGISLIMNDYEKAGLDFIKDYDMVLLSMSNSILDEELAIYTFYDREKLFARIGFVSEGVNCSSFELCKISSESLKLIYEYATDIKKGKNKTGGDIILVKRRDNIQNIIEDETEEGIIIDTINDNSDSCIYVSRSESNTYYARVILEDFIKSSMFFKEKKKLNNIISIMNEAYINYRIESVKMEYKYLIVSYLSKMFTDHGIWFYLLNSNGSFIVSKLGNKYCYFCISSDNKVGEIEDLIKNDKNLGDKDLLNKVMNYTPDFCPYFENYLFDSKMNLLLFYGYKREDHKNKNLFKEILGKLSAGEDCLLIENIDKELVKKVLDEAKKTKSLDRLRRHILY